MGGASLERLIGKVGAWTEEGGRAADRGEERGDRFRGTWRDSQEMPVGLEPCCSLVAKDRLVFSWLVLFLRWPHPMV